MSGKLISWTPDKKVYDAILLLLVISYLGIFCISHLWLYPNTDPILLVIRSTGTLAFILIHIILVIGPLSRLNSYFLPILYNRRHLGVTMFFIALIHGGLSLVYYHGFSDTNPIISLFVSNTNYSSLGDFPFQVLGFFALIILFFMAMTSHDYWNTKLGPRAWKWLHMMVYIAYALTVYHVLTGIMQENVSTLGRWGFGLGIILVATLHLIAGLKERRVFKEKMAAEVEGYLKVALLYDLPNNRAKVLNTADDSIAVFKYGKNISAIQNYCKHQGGPLGEGQIVDGCITCPWHGFQYLPHNGTSPPPFDEKVPTYNLKLIDKVIYVHPNPEPAGTEIRPLKIPHSASDIPNDLYIGWLKGLSVSRKKFIRTAVVAFSVSMLALALFVPYSLPPLKDSTYKTDLVRHEGIFIKEPVPILRKIYQGKIVDYLLVNEGKFSALSSIEEYEDLHQIDLNGRSLTVDAAEIEYDNSKNKVKVLELYNSLESIVSSGHNNEALSQNHWNTLNPIKLKGEIVDVKCYFGVMNPAYGKVHRSCAVRCISGGIPAVLNSPEFDDSYLILVGPNGKNINQDILPVVSEQVELNGQLKKLNNWNYLFLDPESGVNRLSYRRALNTNNTSELCYK